MSRVWLNGKIMALEEAVVPASDHAHLYGDGLFEGIRIYHGQVFKLNEHLKRLYEGVRYLGFRMSMTVDEMKSEILKFCKECEVESGYIRLNVTRGTGLGLDPAHINPEPNVMIMVSRLALYKPEMYETGLNVITTSYRVIPSDCLDPQIKCIGRYAANILAKQEANRAGAGEGLMLNKEGYVAECTGDNIFLIKNGVISTPHPACGILNGITRRTVIELARAKGYTVNEELVTKYNVHAADEAFLTGTAAEVIPMVTLDNQPIGDGKPGPITRELISAFREETKNGTPF